MTIPKFIQYPKGEYSLIQISPTIDSQELVNVGIIVKNIESNELKIELFDDIHKLSQRVHIENKNSLKYTFEILRKQIDKYSDSFIYEQFSNVVKINKPLPISITEDTLSKQLEKLYKEKITLLKTFKPSISANNSQYDKHHIIDNINSYILIKNLTSIVKTRKKMLTIFGSKKQVDTIIYNEDDKPIIASDIISPATSKLVDMYGDSLFTLKNLSDDTIQKRIFYIPTMDNLSTNINSQVRYIKENIRKEGLFVNDSKDQKEYIGQMIIEAERVS